MECLYCRWRDTGSGLMQSGVAVLKDRTVAHCPVEPLTSVDSLCCSYTRWMCSLLVSKHEVRFKAQELRGQMACRRDRTCAIPMMARSIYKAAVCRRPSCSSQARGLQWKHGRRWLDRRGKKWYGGAKLGLSRVYLCDFPGRYVIGIEIDWWWTAALCWGLWM